jgi:hypothetical protein
MEKAGVRDANIPSFERRWDDVREMTTRGKSLGEVVQSQRE